MGINKTANSYIGQPAAIHDSMELRPAHHIVKDNCRLFTTGHTRSDIGSAQIDNHSCLHVGQRNNITEAGNYEPR